MSTATYYDLYQRGAFPDQIDPWGEAGRYFHQVHGEMISYWLNRLQRPLLELGYIVGRETSLQIAEGRQPDLFVHHQVVPIMPNTWDYGQLSAALEVEAGVLVENTASLLDGLFITHRNDEDLVTVIEIISPRNKTDWESIWAYQARRARLQAQGVHVVEVDLTRSVKHLLEDDLAQLYPYHLAIHLANGQSRFIGMEWAQPPKKFALPLRGQVIPLDVNAAYTHAYQQTSLAGHILRETHYHPDELPFPSLISDTQRVKLLEQVQTWQTALDRLRPQI